MKPVKINGFTIVETMLFLGISGLLIMGVLVGTGSAINIQRYHDSVTSLQGHLQQQYSNVANVSNDNMNNTCGGVDNLRGQSDCVILGKYITVDSANNEHLTVKDVLGTTCPTTSVDDLTALQQCNIIVSQINPESYTIEWGSSVITPGGGDMALSMLILRSPLSGAIRTLISDNTTTKIDDGDVRGILSLAALLQPAKMCVDSNGLFTGTQMAVQIGGGTTSASGVESLGENSGC